MNSPCTIGTATETAEEEEQEDEETEEEEQEEEEELQRPISKWLRNCSSEQQSRATSGLS